MAQKALFITPLDVKQFSVLSGNLDDDKIKQWISTAQDTHIFSYLGEDLFNKISTDIINNSLSGVYLSLVNDYIKPMTIHYAAAELLPFAAYTVGNKGAFKHSSENAETMTKEEIDFLVQKHLHLASNYTDKFIKYMCRYYTLFPEYTSNELHEKHPNKNNNFNGWYL